MSKIRNQILATIRDIEFELKYQQQVINATFERIKEATMELRRLLDLKED